MSEDILSAEQVDRMLRRLPLRYDHPDVDLLIDHDQRLRADRDAQTPIIEAARALSDFLENEFTTDEPPRELLDQGYVSCFRVADSDKLDRLSENLAIALSVHGGVEG